MWLSVKKVFSSEPIVAAKKSLKVLTALFLYFIPNINFSTLMYFFFKNAVACFNCFLISIYTILHTEA